MFFEIANIAFRRTDQPYRVMQHRFQQVGRVVVSVRQQACRGPVLLFPQQDVAFFLLPDQDFSFQSLIQSSQFLVHGMEILGSEFHRFFKFTGILSQFLFHLFALADIAQDSRRVPAIRRRNGRQGQFDSDFSAGFVTGGEFERGADDITGAGLPKGFESVGMGGVVTRRSQQLMQIAADCFCRTIAENPFGGLIPERDATIGIHHQYGVLGRLSDRADAGLAVAELLFRLFLLGDVATDAIHADQAPVRSIERIFADKQCSGFAGG